MRREFSLPSYVSSLANDRRIRWGLKCIQKNFFSQMIIAHNYPGGSRKYYADVLHKLIAENMYVDFIYIFIMRGEGAGMWVIV